MIVIQSLSIDIDADGSKVFEYVSDLRNDRHWRREINSTILEGSPREGTLALEDARLSPKVPSYLRKLSCTEWVDGERVVYRTLIGDEHYLRTVRTFHSNGRGGTCFTYLLEFDSAIVKFGLGFYLPRLVVNWVTRTAMRSYLKCLKAIMEVKD